MLPAIYFKIKFISVKKNCSYDSVVHVEQHYVQKDFQKHFVIKLCKELQPVHTFVLASGATIADIFHQHYMQNMQRSGTESGADVMDSIGRLANQEPGVTPPPYRKLPTSTVPSMDGKLNFRQSCSYSYIRIRVKTACTAAPQV